MECSQQAHRGEDEALREIVQRIVSAGNPQQIVLFGSRARRDGVEDSDIDILVIKKSLKALLAYTGDDIPLTHNLEELGEAAMRASSALEVDIDDLAGITP